MSANIRLPNIPEGTSEQQMRYMRSYMYQLVEELNWALDTIKTQTSPNTTTVVQIGSSSRPASSSSIDAEATFNAIKSLIMKSADIVGAYYEEIERRLEGEYVAVSDFGVYKEQTSHEIVENSNSITNVFNNTQEIQTGVNTALGELKSEVGLVDSKVGEVETNLSEEIGTLTDEIGATTAYLKEVKASIKTGELYRDNGVPVYGIEIGQIVTEEGEETFNKFARFTANRLSFYDRGGVEVAYISDKRLYIETVEITGIFQIGGYATEVLANGDVVEKWVGRR